MPPVILKNNLPSRVFGPVGLIPWQSTPNGNKVMTSQSFFVIKLTFLVGVGVLVGVAVGVFVKVGVGVFVAVTLGVTVDVGVLVGVAQMVVAGVSKSWTPANGKK